MNKVKNNQSCITCRYSEESYEDILGAGGQPETILVRRCPFVNDEKVKNGKTLTFGRILYIIVMISEVPDFSEETL